MGGLHVHPAADVDGLTRYIAGEIAGEEGSHVSYIFGRATTAERDLSFPLLAYFFAEGMRHVGDDEAWSDRVSTDATRTEFLSDALS